MYIVDDKNFNFYDRIFNILDGRGINCLPVSKVEMDEKSKPADTFIAVSYTHLTLPTKA